MTVAAALAALAACGEPSAPIVDAPTGAPCAPQQASTLPGVTLAFPPDVACAFTRAQAAAGVTLPYAVTIAAATPDVVVLPGDAGGCARPDPGSGLILFERLAGGGQTYCLCDVGLCPAPPMTPTTLPAGTYPHAFAWDGRNWMGPSDTATPKGAPFPVGAYTLTVSATGTVDEGAGARPFDLRATVTVSILP